MPFSQPILPVYFLKIEPELVRIREHFRWKPSGCIVYKPIGPDIVNEYIIMINLAYSIYSIIYQTIIADNYRHTIITSLLSTTIQTTSILRLVIFESIVTDLCHLYVFDINGCWVTSSTVIYKIVARYIYCWITDDILFVSILNCLFELFIHHLSTFNVNTTSLWTTDINEPIIFYGQ